MSLRSRLPTNWPGLLGAFWLVAEASRRGQPWRQPLSLREELTVTCQGLREDETRWRFGLPARANTGDPFGRLEAFPLMRSHAR